MNLFDALKQYFNDAAPGGSLNPEVTPQGLLDVAAMASTPVPVIGDVLGLAADAKRLYDNPSERTPLNYGMSALGLLPFVPAGMTKLTNSADALRGPQSEALETARKNAVTMLGLPPNNTPMDRAKALGFEDGWAHGSPRNDLSYIQPSRTGAQGPGAYATDYLPESGQYAMGKDGATSYPLMVRRSEALLTKHNNPYDEFGVTADDELLSELFSRGKTAMVTTQEATPDWLLKHGVPEMPERQHYVSVRPENFRSRFAAFDPARVNESDLLGRADPRLLGLIGVLGAGGLGGAYLYNQDKK